MKRVWMPVLAALLGCALLAGATTYGGDDDSKKSETRTTKKPVAGDADKSSLASSESKPRLPNGWGKLRLSKDQHDKVIAVMEKYQPQLRQLEQQIKELKAKQLVDMKALLNDAQKKQLAAAEKTGVSSGDGSPTNSDSQPPVRRRRRRLQNNN